MEGSAVQSGSQRAGAGSARLRIGIVGAGFAARVHARAARLAGAQLVGVATSSPERAAAASAALGAERGFASAAELIASEAVDVVHVCTPNDLHVPLSIAALAAGKRVICEKPVALDSAGAAELAAAAEAAGALVTVPFVYRYYPTVRELRARLEAAGEAAFLFSGGYLQDWLLGADDYNWRVDAPRGGSSRAFADIGSHWCDLVEFVSGQRISSVVARTAIAHDTRHGAAASSFERAAGDEAHAVTTEDVAAVLFATDAGATGTLLVSQVSAGHKNSLWVEISAGPETFAFDQERPDELRIMRRGGTETVPRDFDTLSSQAARYVTLPGGHPQGYQDCFDAFVAESYGAFAGNEPPAGLPVLSDGIRGVRITEAVLESARGGEWVEVPA
ncbi:MAG TPA: Gfo/Idh/MocA family oxidoreductase [Solirubrobacterales bacterium]|nr:Gfo/Idh/MocA family oxidoreductase [Solirubrobacterales bacterium]